MKKIEVKEEDYLEALIKKQERAYEIAKMKEQQKEFINYLEKEINEHKNKEPFIVANICSSYDLTQIELNILKDILQKYKEIIGVLENDNHR